MHFLSGPSRKKKRMAAAAAVTKFAVPAVVGGAVGGIVTWYAEETVKTMVSDPKTSWVIPVAGAIVGAGAGVFFAVTYGGKLF